MIECFGKIGLMGERLRGDQDLYVRLPRRLGAWLQKTADCEGISPNEVFRRVIKVGMLVFENYRRGGEFTFKDERGERKVVFDRTELNPPETPTQKLQ